MSAFTDCARLCGHEPSLAGVPKWAQGPLDIIKWRCASQLRPGRYEVGIYDAKEFNAFATVFERTDLVCISSGLFGVLQRLFGAMLCHPCLLEGSGEVDQAALHFTSPVSCAEFLSGELDNIPALEDEKRLWLRDMLAQTALLYVLEHEFAHICNGHVDLFELMAGTSIVIEVLKADRAPSGLISQTLEWDADCAAIQGVLTAALRPKIETHLGIDSWTLPPRGVIGRIDSALRLISAAIFTCALVFAIYDDADPGSLANTHPHPQHRAHYNMRQIAGLLAYRTGTTADEWIIQMRPVLPQVLEAWRGVFPDADVTGWLVQEPDDIELSKLLAYKACWAELRDQLEPLKREKIRLAPIEFSPNPAFSKTE